MINKNGGDSFERTKVAQEAATHRYMQEEHKLKVLSLDAGRECKGGYGQLLNNFMRLFALILFLIITPIIALSQTSMYEGRPPNFNYKMFNKKALYNRKISEIFILSYSIRRDSFNLWQDTAYIAKFDSLGNIRTE